MEPSVENTSKSHRRAAAVARASFLATCFASMLSACGQAGEASRGEPGNTPDGSAHADAPDAPDTAADGDAGPDAPPLIECAASDNVEVVASAAADEVTQEMLAEGFSPFQSSSGATSVHVTAADIDRLSVSRTETPVYFDDEQAILALPDKDRLRMAWLDGDIPAPDWSTEGLLSMFERAPYTDTRLFERQGALLAYFLRLDGCLADGVPPEPEPFELLRRTVRPVPKLSSVTSRTKSRWYRVREFEHDPAWASHSSSPPIERAGGLGDVLRIDDATWMMWVNGYSGASGFLFRATSHDGADWDFSWYQDHTCTFEGMPDIAYYKRDPSVLHDGARFTMWVEIEKTTAPYLATRIHRTESDDGLVWTNPKPVQGLGDIRAPFVALHDGVYHLWAHASRSVVHATSSDGKAWSSPEVVVARGSSIDELDGFGAFTPSALWLDDRWVLFYAAAYSPREVLDAWHQPHWFQMHLAYATSEDGVTWQKAPQPIWNQVRTDEHWESGDIGRPVAVRQGQAWSLYYTGVEGGEPSIGLLSASAWTP